MGFLDDVKEKTTDLAQAGVAQSKRLMAIAKLKVANLGEEDTIKKAYIELGKLYYAEHGTAPEGAYAAACERITASRAAIETNNDRIAQLKNSSDEEVEEEIAREEAAQAQDGPAESVPEDEEPKAEP